MELQLRYTCTRHDVLFVFFYREICVESFIVCYKPCTSVPNRALACGTIVIICRWSYCYHISKSNFIVLKTSDIIGITCVPDHVAIQITNIHHNRLCSFFLMGTLIISVRLN